MGFWDKVRYQKKRLELKPKPLFAVYMVINLFVTLVLQSNQCLQVLALVLHQ